MAEHTVSPGGEVFPVGAVGVGGDALSPRGLPVEEPGIYRGQLLIQVIVGPAQIFGAEQAEYRSCRDGSHEAAPLVEPFGVSALGDAVADKCWPGGTQGDQLMGINRNIAGVPAAESGLSRP